MANFIIKNKISDPSLIQNFNLNGYAYNEKLSDEFNPVFTRSSN